MRQARRAPDRPVFDDRSARPDRPVFDDRSGRRRRLVRLAGASLGAALAAVLGLMLAAMSGASPIRAPGFPGEGRNADGVQVTTPPQPRLDPAGDTHPDQASGLEPATPATTTGGAMPTQTTKRRIPTHTPDHPKPSKTR